MVGAECVRVAEPLGAVDLLWLGHFVAVHFAEHIRDLSLEEKNNKAHYLSHIHHGSNSKLIHIFTNNIIP